MWASESYLIMNITASSLRFTSKDNYTITDGFCLSQKASLVIDSTVYSKFVQQLAWYMNQGMIKIVINEVEENQDV